jgi:ATP-dependent DNA helicase RecQ
MHKVKGLEFDAVIIPPSFTNLPQVENSIGPVSDEVFAEEVAEERRLLYVAITRARFRLVFIQWERENAVLNQQRFLLKEDMMKKMGIRIDPGFQKFFIAWAATDDGDKSFALVHEELRVGAPVTLVRPKTFWFVKTGNTTVGCLSKEVSEAITRRVYPATQIIGFVCSNIYKWTLEETIAFDKAQRQKNIDSNFAEKWTAFPRERGYIYIVEFSGYGMVESL